MKNQTNKNKSTTAQIGIIGFGNMAEAIVAGLLAKKIITKNNFNVLEPAANRVSLCKKKYTKHVYSDTSVFLQNSQIILIAVKPQQINDVLNSLGVLSAGTLVLSIVTGITFTTYQKYLGQKTKIIRIMPNTPALVQAGMTGYVANKYCNKKDKTFCELIFSAIGLIMEFKNEQALNAVTAVSGSGPAFVYEYARAMIQGATKLGLTNAQAKILVLQTLSGAVQMMQTSKESPEELRVKVTSKNGTTEAGLNYLSEKEFVKTIEICLKKAQLRATALSKST